jgi:putative membrane protein
MGETGGDQREAAGRPPQVDYRFLLANERTFLAYVRTALSLQVAGLGVLQFLTQGHAGVRETLGTVLVLLGSFAGLVGYLRFRSNDRTIRAGRDMPTSRSPVVVASVVALLPLVAALLVALS